MLKKIFLFTAVVLFINGIIWAQDFGFGFEEDEETPKSSASFKAGGEISAEATPFFYNFNDDYPFVDSSWNVKLDLAFTSPYIDIYSSSNFNSDSINELWSRNPDLKEKNHTPLIIDEAYLRAYIGAVNIEAGYRKLTWGKVDSNGPLDVINPIDYTDLINITEIKERKIARPMLHITLNTGSFSKLEGVFIPNFTPHRFASQGRWMPSQYSNMTEATGKEIYNRLIYAVSGNPLGVGMINNMFASGLPDYSFEFPDTSGIEYFQAGLRFTTTVNSTDLGFQYFYGNQFRPNYCLSNDGINAFVVDVVTKNMMSPGSNYTGDLSLIAPKINYTRYHQIGADYARVLFDFNLRAEAAINITEDIHGDDGSLQNPFVAWAFGFDRNLFWGINFNAQCNETIRLLNGNVGDNPVLDSEAGTDITSTRISARLTKSFLRDKLESGITCIWDIEDSDCYLIPSLTWTQGNLTAKIAAGVFKGNKDGELGQYWENSFIKIGLSIVF
ncbi:hypothetical protein [Treponema sp. R6D11]